MVIDHKVDADVIAVVISVFGVTNWQRRLWKLLFASKTEFRSSLMHVALFELVGNCGRWWNALLYVRDGLGWWLWYGANLAIGFLVDTFNSLLHISFGKLINIVDWVLGVFETALAKEVGPLFFLLWVVGAWCRSFIAKFMSWHL